MSWEQPTQKGELCKDIKKMNIVIWSWITNEHSLKKSAWLNYSYCVFVMKNKPVLISIWRQFLHNSLENGTSQYYLVFIHKIISRSLSLSRSLALSLPCLYIYFSNVFIFISGKFIKSSLSPLFLSLVVNLFFKCLTQAGMYINIH